MNRRDFIIGIGAGLASRRVFANAPATSDLRNAARDAWLFALPLIEVTALRARSNAYDGRTNPMNVLRHARSLAGPTTRAVTTPNNDTLYSTAFVDTTRGPVDLDVPDSGKRYLSVQIMDMYTDNNFILSPRTRGGAAGAWRLISPDSKPQGSRDLRLATPHAWLVTRILVDGLSDLPAVHAIQDRLGLRGSASRPSVTYVTPSSDWSAYFAAADRLLGSDPPPFKKGLESFVKVRDAGIGRDFSRAGYGPAAAAAIDAGVAEATAIGRNARLRNDFIGGWTYPRPDLGEFGDHFVFRAIVAITGIGALTPAEAMYLRAEGDGNGLFNGDGLYRLSLPRPLPVDAFWSLTMYQAMGDGRFFLTENALNRYSIGNRTEGLVRGSNGSIDIWIGRFDPGGTRTANWLPAPRRGPFALTLRAYLPRQALLSGDYRLPAIVRA
jgi:hypothetical protein